MLPRELVSILAFFVSTQSFAKGYGTVTTHKVADGVYLFTTTPYGEVGFCGNSVAIISEEGALVFDSGATPATARVVLEEIRKVTSRPVQYLVNSHWHWDHWGGNQVYRAAFPAIHIITHQQTRDAMLKIEPRWNSKGLSVDLPRFLDDFRKRIDALKASHASDAEIRSKEELFAADRAFLAEKQSIHKTYPDVTFSVAMTLHLADREIQILQARAITPGDTYLFLPKERILVTGDIVVAPVPFAIGGTYPAEWLRTLQSFVSLNPKSILPGHGDAQAGTDQLQKTVRVFEKVMQRVRDDKTNGLTIQQTQADVGKQSRELAEMLGIQDRATQEQLRPYFLDVFAGRAYRELSQPLEDVPDGLP